MNNNMINKEAEQIKQCCDKIEVAAAPQNVQQELSKIKECCARIEQNLQ
jgi:hypothetical protein